MNLTIGIETRLFLDQNICVFLYAFKILININLSIVLFHFVELILLLQCIFKDIFDFY